MIRKGFPCLEYVVDTSALLNDPTIITKFNCVILSHVLRELEKHKNGHSSLSFKARKAIRFIEEHIQDISFDFKDYRFNLNQEYDPEYVDNKILQSCYENNYGLITDDLLLKIKAKSFGIKVIDYKSSVDDYCGYKEVIMTDEEIAHFYENLEENRFDLLVNQYLIIKNTDLETVETAKWDGQYMQLCHPKPFTTNMFGKFAPKDEYQKCALDSLIHNQITMIKGKPGSGKSLIALNFAMSMLEKHKYDKLICFVNPTSTRNSAELGYYPGTPNEKLLSGSVGAMFGSKFGDIMQVQMLINNQKLVFIPFKDIRGFDTTGMNAIVYIVEAQNLDIDLMKLAIQRCGEDTKLIIDGDYNSQVDRVVYEGSNNGMRRVSEVFRGKDFYGEVELKNIYRSRMAEVADMM